MCFTCGTGPRILVNNDWVIEILNGCPAAKIQKPITNWGTFIAAWSSHQSRAQQPRSWDSLHGTLSPSVPGGDNSRYKDDFDSVSLHICLFSFPGIGKKHAVDIIMDTTPHTRIRSLSSNLKIVNNNVTIFGIEAKEYWSSIK